jgi:hypothetical protein
MIISEVNVAHEAADRDMSGNLGGNAFPTNLVDVVDVDANTCGNGNSIGFVINISKITTLTWTILGPGATPSPTVRRE